MGTNYYLMMNHCSKCGHAPNSYHIGKSSGGWCFSLHVEPSNNINNIDDIERLVRFWDDIVDEYGNKISVSEMLEIIKERKGTRHHKIGGGCIGHGDGPYDYLIGEFS